MSTTDFEEIAGEFRRRVAKTIWCTLATVDTRGRARTRNRAPGVGRPDGLARGTGRNSEARAHRRAPRRVAPFLGPDADHEQVTIDARATVESSSAARHAAWAAFQVPEPPYGFDPEPIWAGGPEGDSFVAIRLAARRIELFGAPPMVWKAPAP